MGVGVWVGVVGSAVVVAIGIGGVRVVAGEFLEVGEKVTVGVGAVGISAELVFFGVGEAVFVAIDGGDLDAPEEFFGALAVWLGEDDVAVCGAGACSFEVALVGICPSVGGEGGGVLEAVEGAGLGGLGDGGALGGVDVWDTVVVGIPVGGGGDFDIGGDVTVWGIGVEGVGVGAGFLLVGPAVAIGIGSGEEGVWEEGAAVEGFFPSVAKAVGVLVEDGVGELRRQNPEASD